MSSDIQSHDPVLYFDALTRVGPRANKHAAHPWRLEELERELAHCSISGALVLSTMCVNYDAMHENLRLVRSLESTPQFAPAWNVMPEGDEFPDVGTLLSKMRESGVSAVHVHPLTNGWELYSRESHRLFNGLAGAAVPTFFSRSEFATYRDLEEILDNFPTLPVVLTGAHWEEQRKVLPLVRAHRNLHLTFDLFQIHYGLEELVGEGLENQLIFGSNAPQMSAGAHRAFVDLATVPTQAKQKIAGGNILRLLRREAPPAADNHNEDVFMKAVREGLPLPIPFLDMHMHILDEGLHGAGGSFRMHRGGPLGVHAMLQRIGCSGGGFMSWNGTVGCDILEGNRCTRAALDASPPGFWGLASFSPTHFSESEMETQIRSVYSDSRFIGMKPYVRFGVEYSDPCYAPWWAYGNEQGFYAGIHRVRSDFKEIDFLAEKYPNVRWVVYHCGESYAVADMAIDSIMKHANVYAEITLTPVPCGIIDYLVTHLGADRVTYGSDLPMRDPRQQLGWVVFSRLTEEEKRKVLRETALKIIAPSFDKLPKATRQHFQNHKL